MKYPGFVGPAYRARSEYADGEDLINWYVERNESPGATGPTTLYPTPGFQAIADLTYTPGRGLFATRGKAYAVFAEHLYEFLTIGNPVYRGKLNTDANPVTATTNGDGGGQIMFTSGGSVFIYDMTSFVITAKPDVPALMGGMLDGYFIALDPAASKIRISNLLDGLTWDPTQFAQRDTAPDPWRALLISQQRIYLFGERTSEVWANNGNFPFPFAPIAGAVLPYGIAAPFSVAEHRGKPTWLAQNKDGARMIVQATGYSNAERISTHAVEYALNTYSRVDDAEAMVYQYEGHSFYTITFPSAGASWTVDENGQWARRGTWNNSTMRFDAWRPRGHIYEFNTHLVLDRLGHQVYAMSPEWGTDIGGGPIRRVRRAPTLPSEQVRRRYPSFELALDTGLAPQAGQGSDPQVCLRMSKDGGHTWGPERWRSAGRAGEYGRRVIWNRCGSGANVAFEISVADPVPWCITDASLRQPGERR